MSLPTTTRPSLRSAVQALRTARQQWAAQHWPADAAIEFARMAVLVAQGMPLHAASHRAMRRARTSTHPGSAAP